MADARARELLNSVKGPLPEAVARLEVASRALPADTDFHFYCNFPQFKRPLQELAGSMSALLSRIGTAKELRTEPAGFVDEPDEVHDWLIALQDDLLEKVGGALDEFQRVRNERKRRKGPDFDEVAVDSRKKGRTQTLRENSLEETQKLVKIAKRGNDAKGFVPTYIKSIPRPQDKFDVAVDNSNTAFQHPTEVVVRSSGLSDGGVPVPIRMVDTGRNDAQAKTAEEAAEPASSSVSQRVASVHLNHLDKLEDYANKLKLRRAAHPLEDELRSSEYKDGALLKVEPEEPLPLAATPFTFVDTEAGLKDLAAKLSSVREIAVDLENHHYRSFQGFVCIMQISTRTEDFIVDTLALRSQIGPCLGAIFSDSDVKKVMHGADRDVVWLQRDFGIYLCNLFDTGQAARVLEFPGFGLAFLLQHFCSISADKRYQLADWRLRPLTPDMLRYAREDTHYLLYIYDRLRELLIAARAEKPEDPLLQVFECSREVCLKLYEKELLTDTSHLHLYGLIEKKLRPLQLGVLAELYAWRDQVARKEDESTGFVCPNKLLLQLAEQMPQSLQELQKLLKGVRTLVHQQPATILSIIRSTKENFLSKMDVEVGETSKTSLCLDPANQSQVPKGKSDVREGQNQDEIVIQVQEGKSDTIEGQELDEKRNQFREATSDRCEGQELNEKVSQFQEGKSDSKEGQELDEKVSNGGAVGSADHENSLANTTGRSVEGLLNQEAARTHSSFPEDVSVGGIVSSPAIVRRAMVSSLFAPRSRSSVLSRSIQCSMYDAAPSQLCDAPGKVKSDANRTCAPELGVTTENSSVPEQLIVSQTLKMQAPCSFVDAETSAGMNCNHSARAGTSFVGFKETVLTPTGLLATVQMRSPELSFCGVLPPDDSGNLSADCSKLTTYVDRDGLGFLAEKMQVDTGGNTGLPATAEGVDVASPPAIVDHCSQMHPEAVAARRCGGFASLLGRPSKKHDGSKTLDKELMDARRKAEQITSSVCLPFYGGLMNVEDATVARSQTQAVVTDMTSKTVLQKLGVQVRDKVKHPFQKSKEWGEVVSFEAGDDRLEMVNEYRQMPDRGEKRQHRWAGRLPETQQPAEGRLEESASTSSPFPTPLSAVQRVLRKDQHVDEHTRDKKAIPRFDRNSWKKRKAMATQASSSEPDVTRKSKKKRQQKSSFQQGSVSAGRGGVEIPFDYEAAKQVLGVEAELNKNRSDDRPHGKPSGKRKKPNVRPTPLMVFDPYRTAMTEPKAEGIRPGNRRQVFPQSGNRSMTFK